MNIELKNGSIIGLNVDCDLKDNENFIFNGDIIYQSDYLENYPYFINLSFLGKGLINKGFNGVKIVNIYKDEETERKISKFENIEDIDRLILKELNSYENLEKLSIQKMDFIQNKKISLNIENIKLNSIEYSEFLNLITIKGNIYTNRKTDTREINIFSFIIESYLNDENIIKVRNCDLSSVYEIENYENEILKEYINYFVENNNYIKDYINSKKLETYNLF